VQAHNDISVLDQLTACTQLRGFGTPDDCAFRVVVLAMIAFMAATAQAQAEATKVSPIPFQATTRQNPAATQAV
jgi:hypothetical protein